LKSPHPGLFDEMTLT